VRLHALGGHASASFSDLLNPTANASSSLLARFSPLLEAECVRRRGRRRFKGTGDVR
jgi:hypothetical protein